ncbi:uncharacterized protein LOC132627088 [Lycium barbarum]|uniref:uncharacterized protein LOC132627088 n=1 Tax=Lycium barbarum TaxID=112863 RepID=UPI00293EED31|nr:uncharacterized protein LOC132627088 [Lycium barbarum]
MASFRFWFCLILVLLSCPRSESRPLEPSSQKRRETMMETAREIIKERLRHAINCSNIGYGYDGGRDSGYSGGDRGGGGYGGGGYRRGGGGKRGTRRRRRLHIQRIRNYRGRWLQGDNNVAKAAVKYYKKQFNLNLKNRNSSILDCIPEIITAQNNDMLTRLPNEEEIKQAVFSMSKESSTGPDGYNGMFFQSCWTIIKADLIAFVHEFLSGKLLNPLLYVLISENQSGFVSGRSITDNVMLTQEIVHGISKTNNGGNVVLKLDMAKAYDMLSWTFLQKVLNKFGFCLEKYLQCVGDPISPSLFIIAAEVLSRSLNNLLKNPDFTPFSMHKNGPQIVDLAYADDIVIFSSGNSKSIKLIMNLIKKYETVSGQMVNKDKSFFLTDPKTCAYRINRIRVKTGFLDKNFPFTYLGCPIYIGKKRLSYFDNMLAKIIKRLNAWQGNMLSCGGRQVLITSVIQSLPIYMLSAINPPKGTLELIEKHIVNFFWGAINGKNKYHWTSWEKLCFPKNEAGIGIRSMDDISKTLTVKRWWHFRVSKSIWADFLVAKYCPRMYPIGKKWCSHNSQAWKHLLWARNKCENLITWKINNGNCNFWWDNWTELGPLAKLCPNHMNRKNSKKRVRDFMIDNRWDPQKLYNTLPSQIALHILSIEVGQNNKEDYAIWNATKDGHFTNGSAWNLIRSHRPVYGTMKNIWHKSIPFKQSFMFGSQDDNDCMCCFVPKTETLQHVFVEGRVAEYIWKAVGQWAILWELFITRSQSGGYLMNGGKRKLIVKFTSWFYKLLPSWYVGKSGNLG